MEGSTVSNNLCSEDANLVTHCCSRASLLGNRSIKFCNEPNSSSWSCHRATCNRCVDLNWDFYADLSGFGDYSSSRHIMTTYRSIIASAKIGCHLCSLLCEGIAAVTKSVIDQDILSRDTLQSANLSIQLRRHASTMVSLIGPAGEWEFPVEFYTSGGLDSQAPGLSIGPADHVPAELDIHVLSEFAKKHMDVCMGDHPICSTNDRNSRPTRVLDVGIDATGQDIVLSTLEDDNALYITLSHCWGDNSSMLTTTSKTIAQHNLGIPFAELPKTFQDAVEITRRLGFRYLWIDSLCIVQDDKEDWEIESGKMAAIYRESCLTIAATASADSSGGLFFSRWTSVRKHDQYRKVNVETFEYHRTFAGTNFVVYARLKLRNGHEVIVHRYSAENPAPLLSRAWAYQERMLAPRILHVHMEELFWECQNDTLCECGEFRWGQELTKQPAYNDSLSLKGKIACVMAPEVLAEDVHRLWFDIVQEYSQLALTKESDRLPALSGLASLLSQKLRTPYLAGL
ncbi:heterokaryon incompatibility protein-domain-containing protein [Rhexocercosporidium sp. MPI-PUGE-AT-0058]|nr:heterokaryon incompatibility protein-domain-containing protein [Rhexocercosporidium sp. MPI-PUGE-AT-0058]